MPITRWCEYGTIHTPVKNRPGFWKTRPGWVFDGFFLKRYPLPNKTQLNPGFWWEFEKNVKKSLKTNYFALLSFLIFFFGKTYFNLGYLWLTWSLAWWIFRRLWNTNYRSKKIKLWMKLTQRQTLDYPWCQQSIFSKYLV